MPRAEYSIRIRAVIGASVRLKPSTFCCTPSSYTRKFDGFKPGTNWCVFSSITPTSMVTSGTFTCKVTLPMPSGFLNWGATGAGVGRGLVGLLRLPRGLLRLSRGLLVLLLPSRCGLSFRSHPRRAGQSHNYHQQQVERETWRK